MSKGDMGKVDEGVKYGGLQPLHIKNGKTMLERCPYCYRPHVDDYLCLKAKVAGITSDQLPDAYNVDMETGEIK